MKLLILKSSPTFCKTIHLENFSLSIYLKINSKQILIKKSENLDQDDPFYFSIYESLSRKLEEDFEAIEQFSKKRKRKIQQNKPIDTIEKKKNCSDIRKNKMVIYF